MKSLKETKKTVISASEALQRLIDGNYRFSKNLTSLASLNHQERRQKLVNQQNPFAIVLTCSDSRVPAEFIFDQGLGDLFVIRVAGNVVAPSIVGSIEFAASTFGTQLVLVMGHSNCGAVAAALKTEQENHGVASENLRDIVTRITPAIRPIINLEKKQKVEFSKEDLLDQCIQANVMASVAHVRSSSKIIESLIQQEKLEVIGAEYSLETGRVEFFNAPQRADLQEIKTSVASKQLLNSTVQETHYVES